MADIITNNIKNNTLKLHTFEELQELYSVYINEPEDRDSIKRAFTYMINKHEGQFRRSGEPYYHHLIEVAYILATLQCGPATICAGLLHDVVEDTDTPIEEIKNGWGEDVAKIVSEYFPDTSLSDMITIVNRYKEGEAWKKNITINEDEWEHIQEIMKASSELDKFVEYDKLIFDEYFDDYE